MTAEEQLKEKEKALMEKEALLNKKELVNQTRDLLISENLTSTFAENIVSNTTTAEEIKQSIKEIKEKFNLEVEATVKNKLSSTRNRGVNLTNISMAGINTIEFRMPNGSIDIDVVRDNIKLFGKLVDVSKEMSLDPETKIEEFDNFKSTRTKDEEIRADSLLKLLFDDDSERKKYKERWESVKEYNCFKNEEIDNIKYNKKQNKIKENDMTSPKVLDNSDELDR